MIEVKPTFSLTDKKIFQIKHSAHYCKLSVTSLPELKTNHRTPSFSYYLHICHIKHQNKMNMTLDHNMDSNRTLKYLKLYAASTRLPLTGIQHITSLQL